MHANETGVLDKSQIYFSSPSPNAQSLLYYPICVGHFYCVKGYHCARKNYNSFLIMHLLDGQCRIKTRDTDTIAHKGETIFLNCYEAHEYSTDTHMDAVWLHFDGVNSLSLYNEIKLNHGNILYCGDNRNLIKTMEHLLSDLADTQERSESALSLSIYQLICELFNPQRADQNDTALNAISIEKAKKFVADNLSDHLTVSEIAAHIHMSASHFSRIFKQKTGFSPYDYVLVTRLNRAKDYLRTSQMTVSDIAYTIGFNSESNFIFFFTSNTGMSPNKFRKLKF